MRAGLEGVCLPGAGPALPPLSRSFSFTGARLGERMSLSPISSLLLLSRKGDLSVITSMKANAIPNNHSPLRAKLTKLSVLIYGCVWLGMNFKCRLWEPHSR